MLADKRLYFIPMEQVDAIKRVAIRRLIRRAGNTQDTRGYSELELIGTACPLGITLKEITTFQLRLYLRGFKAQQMRLKAYRN